MMKTTLMFLLSAGSLFGNSDPCLEKANEVKVDESSPSKWLSYAKEAVSANSLKRLISTDLSGKNVILEWKATDIQSSDLADFKREMSELASQVLAPVELQFLQAYPQAASQELFLKLSAPFLEKGEKTVDWKGVEETIKSTIKQFYLTDLSSFGISVIKPLLNDLYLIVKLKEQETGQVLGFAMFAITPALDFGNVKLINLAVVSKESERSLERLLMSSIFKIFPKVERVFLYVRPTDKKALETYSDWGFTQDQTPIQDPNHKVNMAYLILLEYRADLSHKLQETAEKFIAME